MEANVKPTVYLMFVTACTLAVSACTWVKPTPGGEKVRLLSSAEVDSCKNLGTTTGTLKDTIAGVQRSEEKVNKEMQTLARNSAAEMGGDAVVPIGKVHNGQQTFEVYKCVNP